MAVRWSEEGLTGEVRSWAIVAGLRAECSSWGVVKYQLAVPLGEGCDDVVVFKPTASTFPTGWYSLLMTGKSNGSSTGYPRRGLAELKPSLRKIVGMLTDLSPNETSGISAGKSFLPLWCSRLQMTLLFPWFMSYIGEITVPAVERIGRLVQTNSRQDGGASLWF